MAGDRQTGVGAAAAAAKTRTTSRKHLSRPGSRSLFRTCWGSPILQQLSSALRRRRGGAVVACRSLLDYRRPSGRSSAAAHRSSSTRKEESMKPTPYQNTPSVRSHALRGFHPEPATTSPSLAAALPQKARRAVSTTLRNPQEGANDVRSNGALPCSPQRHKTNCASTILRRIHDKTLPAMRGSPQHQCPPDCLASAPPLHCSVGPCTRLAMLQAVSTGV